MTVTISVKGNWEPRVVEVLDTCSCDIGNCMDNGCTLGYEAEGVEFYCLMYRQKAQWEESGIASKRHCPYCGSCDGTGHARIVEYVNTECDGVDSINMANSVFRVFADSMALDCDHESLCGVIEVSGLDSCIKKAIYLLNHVEELVIENTSDQHSYVDNNGPIPEIKKSCLIMSCGRDVDYWKHRINQFITLCKLAKRKGIEVIFG